MTRSNLASLTPDMVTTAIAEEAFDLAMEDLAPELLDENLYRVAAAVARGIGALIDAGQRNVDRLQTYSPRLEMTQLLNSEALTEHCDV